MCIRLWIFSIELLQHAQALRFPPSVLKHFRYFFCFLLLQTLQAHFNAGNMIFKWRKDNLKGHAFRHTKYDKTIFTGLRCIPAHWLTAYSMPKCGRHIFEGERKTNACIGRKQDDDDVSLLTRHPPAKRTHSAGKWQAYRYMYVNHWQPA